MKFILSLLILLTGTFVFGQTTNMPVTGNNSITGCAGTVRDNGGNGNYANNSNGTLTICSGNANYIVLNFSQFNVEQGYDFLTIYSGTGTGGTVIATLTGNALATNTYNIQNTCVTLLFTSDGSINASGFQLTYSCVPAVSCSDGIQNGTETGVDCGGCGGCPPCPATTTPATVTATSNIYNLPCGGGPVNLNAVGVSTTPILTSTFNAGNPGPGWTFTGSGMFTNPCGNSPNGTTHIWFGNASPHPRMLTTNGMDLSCGGNICFDLRYAIQGGTGSCEGPDLPNEGVTLSYSTNCGATFQNIAYFHPNGTVIGANPGTTTPGIAGNTAFTTWANYCFNLPPAAQTANTIIRWSQLATSGAGFDHWGLDEVVITRNNCNPYYYNWAHIPGSPNSPSNTVNVTTTTTYNVIYTNGINDTASASVTINVAGPAASTVSTTPVNYCVGPNSGSATFTGNGATPGNYSFQVTGPGGFTATIAGSPSATLSSLPIGNYTLVTTHPSSGCFTTLAFVITAGPFCCSVSVVPTNLTCNVANAPCNGSINAIPANGQGPYTYQWYTGVGTGSPIVGQTAQSINNRCAGTYTVRITDNTGCTSTATTTLTQPTALTVSNTFTNVTCNGSNNGSITATASGGTPAYTYTLGTTTNTTGVFSPLSPGTYTITATSSTGCTATTTRTITQPPAIGYTINSVTNAFCTINNGTINISASGGSGSYTYSTGSVTNTNGSFTGLAVGSYTILITDGNGCTHSTYPITVNGNNTPVISLDSVSNVTCFGGNSGFISVSVTGNFPGPAYDFSINGSAPGNQNTFTNLSAGTYTIVVDDPNGCVDTVVVTITAPPLLTSSATQTNVSCFGACNGTITNNISGGTAPYTYSLDGGLTFNNPPTTGLCAGTYYLVVRDANGCLTNQNITITQPSQITYSASMTPGLCGFATGQYVFTSITGGAGGPYSVSFGGSAFTTNYLYTALPAGFDTIIVQDAAGCQIIGLALINNIEAPFISNSTVTNNQCFGDSAGQIFSNTTVSPSGLLPPYFFSINGSPFVIGNTNLGEDHNFINLVNGTYITTVMDANGCLALDTLTITSPPPLTLAYISTNVLCNGASTGSIQFLGGGGTPFGSPTFGYLYSIDNGATTNTTGVFSGLTAGTYQPYMEDANGCIITLADIIITEPPAIVVATVAVNPMCYNECNGTLQLNALGGVPNYLYSINNGVNYFAINTFNSVCSGTINYVVKDVNNCTASGSVVMNNPVQLAISTTFVNATCGFANGSITANGSGGAFPYTYTINSGTYSPPNVFSSLAAGTYNVSVQDQNSCIAQVSQPIIQTGAPSITNIAVTNPLCNGGTGSIVVTATGGTTAYSYSLDGGAPQGASNFTGIAVGPHNVAVTDALGCTVSSPFTITQPAILAMNAPVITPVQCNGASTGSITLNPSGGTQPYAYSFNGGATFGSVNNITSIPAGTYNVQVRDFNNCLVTVNATIAQPTPIVTAITQVNATCFNSCNGSINLNASGGTGVLSYNWSLNIAPSNSGTATSVCAGVYNVIITDNNGCSITTPNITITQPPLVDIVSAIADSVLCFGQANGQISVVANNATTYAITGPSGPLTNGTGLFTGLLAGYYNITVSDAIGCQAQTNVFVYEPTTLTLNTTGDVTSCTGIPVTYSGFGVGGTSPYTYNWNTGATTQSIVYNAINDTLLTVTVTDAYGCTAGPGNMNITLIPPVTIDPIADQYVCAGDSVFITATAQGGVQDYIFNWTHHDPMSDTNSSWLTGSNNPTSYWVIVKDLCIQYDSTEVLVYEYQAPTFDLTGPVDGCAPQTETFNIINVSSPISNCTWDFGNGNTGVGCATVIETYDTAGVYSVQFDYEAYTGCPFDTTFTNVLEIFQVPIFDSINLVNPLCFGAANGTITVYGSLGNLPYNYQLNANPPQALNQFTGLIDGTYTVTLSDVNTCFVDSVVTLTQPTQLVINSVTIVDVLCNGLSTGSITIGASGGTAPLSYSFNNGTTFGSSNSLSSLPAGTYNLVVRDANLCTVDSIVYIVEPTLFQFNVFTVANASCYNVCDGEIVVTTMGGTGPATYVWSANATTGNVGTASNLCDGFYNLTVTDGNSCSIDSLLIAVTEPPQIVVTSLIVDSIVCNGNNDGSIQITATNGNTYELNGPMPTVTNGSGTFFGLMPGTYTITIYDVNLCSIDTTVTVYQPTPLVINTVTVVNVLCNGLSTGSITIGASGGIPSLMYSFNNGVTFGSSNSQSSLPAGTYNLIVRDMNLCTDDSLGVIISEPALFQFNTFTVANASCYNVCDGEIVVTTNGGVAPATYVWSANAATGNVGTASNLCDGLYNLTVTDFNGCSIDSIGISVTEPPQIVITTLTIDSITCFGLNNGQIQVTATNGNSYQLSGPMPTVTNATGTFPGLMPGTYTIRIYDVNLCFIDSVVNVYQPTQLTLTNSGDTTVCYATPVTHTATGGGGTLAYSYSWDTGATGNSLTYTALQDTALAVTITDANGCTLPAQTINITVIPLLNINPIANQTLCIGDSILTTAVANNGLAPYVYTWTNLAPGATGNQQYLHGTNNPNSYWVHVTDQCNNIDSTQALVYNYQAPTFNLTGPVNGCSPQLENFNIVGASSPLSNCSWNFGNSTTAIGCGAQTSNYTVPGVYSVTFSYEAFTACQFDTTFTNILEIYANPIIDSIVTTNPLCFGAANGTATVYASSGNPAYSYQLGAGPLQLNNNFNGLTAGFYSITLSDINNCVASSSINLFNPPALTINSIAVTDALCFGAANGTITLTAAGGTAPYQYSFNGGTTYTSNPVMTGLIAGTYNVFIRDTNMCTVNNASVVVGQPTPVVFTSVTVVNASCFGSTNGSITVVGSGGTPGPGYTYTWSANAATGNSAVANGLGAGTYNVTITDNNNCSVDSLGIVVTSPPQITITSIVRDSVNCFGGNDGSVTINNTNAVQFSITPASTGVATPNQGSSTFNGLIADSYTVRLTDANGCTFDSSFQIFQPTQIQITSVVVTPNSCNGDNTGGITITATGGTGNYMYSFGGSPYGPSNSNLTLAAGTYAASVQDFYGCQVDSLGILITQPTALNVDLMDIVDATCYNQCNGSITATISGGVGPYSYTWSNGAIDSLAIINLCDGLYNLQVTDDNGCIIDTNNNAVAEPPQIVFVSLLTDSVNCNGASDGIIDITATNTTSYTIDNGSGPITQANGNFTGLPAGFYTIELQDVNGCSVFNDTTLYEPNAIQLTTGNDTTVCPNSPANLNAFVVGGSAPYSFDWTGGAGFPTGPNQVATTATTQMYYVNGSDANGCTFGPDSTLISVFDALTTTTLSDITICQGATTTASVTVLTGVPTYTYNWSPAPVSGQGSASAVLSNGNYSVTVTDQCANQVVQNISVTNFMEPTLSFTGFSNGCAPHTVTLNPNNASISNCTWNFGNGSSLNGCGPVSYTYQNGGVYSPTFTFTTSDGCMFDTTINAAISVSTVPDASFTFNPSNPSIINNTVQFTNTSSGGSSYSWNFGGIGTSNQENPTFTYPPNVVENYNTCLIVSQTFGSVTCSDTYCSIVPIQEEFTIYVPNAFTPDSDEHNNTFRAIVLGEKANSFEMLIFDRWGQLIFQSFDHTIGWDGTFQGKVCQDGTYIWKIRMKTKDVDDVVTKVGHVTILR